MNRYSSYFYYAFSAKRRHNLHSPFVYEMSDKCLNVPIFKEHRQIIDKQSIALGNNKQSITISDFGAGSKIMGNERLINAIFKNSRSSKRYADLLYQLAAYYQPKHILELGTSLGWGALHLHLGCPEAIIDTVEGCPQTFEAAKTLFPVQSKNIRFHNRLFDSYLNQLEQEKFDLIFIDGNHRGAALITYIELLFEHSHDHTLWVLDDIRWSDDMWKAWEKIFKDRRFHVSIDFLRMGILVRRESQEKEAFILK